MTRALIALAIRSGIPPTVWLEQPDWYIETAIDLLTQDDD